LTDAAVRTFVDAARHAVLATVDPAGMPRLVPIGFVLDEASAGEATTTGKDPDGTPLVLYSAIDEKPKRMADPLALARVRDLLARPAASVLVDRWSEDWERLGWVRLACRGEIVRPDADRPGSGAEAAAHARAVAALRAKYPQYVAQHLEARPLIRLTCTVAGSWGAIEEEP